MTGAEHEEKVAETIERNGRYGGTISAAVFLFPEWRLMFRLSLLPHLFKVLVEAGGGRRDVHDCVNSCDVRVVGLDLRQT